MAVPSYTTDLNDIYIDTDNFTAVGGGRVTAVETDDYIQGSNCWSHDPFSSGIEGGIYSSAETIAAGDAVYIWTKCDVAATLDTHTAGGIQLLVGSGSTDYKAYYALGSDDYQYGGWKCIPVDPTLTPSTTIGTPTATTSWFGVRWSVPGSGAAKGYPMKIDAMRHGRQIEITAGEIANPASWDTTAIYDSTTIRQWGIVQPTASGAEVQGLVYWGTAASLVYSRDSNKTITIIDTEWTATDFTQILFANTSNDIVWDNVGLLALGTNNRGIINVTAGTITWTNSVFQGINTTTLITGCVLDGSKWLSTNEVTAGGASLLNCKILTPTVAISSYNLLWNTATNPNGKLDGMEFSKGTNAHHAISFSTAAPQTMTLTDISFVGYSATIDSTSTALLFPDTGADVTWTVNLVSCTGTISYTRARATDTVVLVANPVALLVRAQTTTGVAIQDARVLVLAGATGPFPSAAAVTITSATTTATVTHTAHGLSNGDEVMIRGANENNYNGIRTISNVTTNTYDYTIIATASPATGTITSTFVFINGLTDINGEISDTRTYSANQLLSGRVRKSSSSPYYKTSQIVGTVNKDTGLTINVIMLPDE